MSLPRISLNFFGILLFVLCLLSSAVAAQNTIQFQADEWETDGNTQATKARGNVTVEVGPRVLKAEAVDIRPQENRIDARGKIKLTEGLLSVEGDEAQVEVHTSKGNFRNAVLRYGATLYVEGRKLEALGENRFKVTNGKISLCQDCPQSWSVVGTSIELEVEGYAEIHHALFQVKDQPVAYFPIFYFPIKTKRQSGFLIPEIVFSQDLGEQYGQPYFWAIAPDQDATLEYRYMTLGGQRVAVDYRYLYSERSFIKTKGSYVRNFQVKNVDVDRYGFNISQRLQISPHWVQRFRGELASDTRFTSNFGSDFDSARLPTLSNKVSLAWQNNGAMAYTQGFWNSNNLVREEANGVPTQGPLNAIPDFHASIPCFSLLGPLRFQTDFDHLGLRRKGEPVDPETNWIRTGDRSTFRSRAYMPLTIADLALLETTVEARADFYRFDAPGFDPSASRARVTFEERLSAELFRVYNVDLGSLKAVKHTWEPLVSWGASPQDLRSDHPFFRQLYPATADRGQLVAPKFDIYDFSETPLENASSQEVRLRPHHLVSWGLGTRLIGRYQRAAGAPLYDQIMGLDLSQDYDLENDVAQRLNIRGFGNYAGLRVRTQIALDVKTKEADVRNDVLYRHSALELSLEQSIRKELETYETSIRIKFLRPWSFYYAAGIDAKIKSESFSEKITDEHYQVRYDSSASKCWFFSLSVDRSPHPDLPKKHLVRYWPQVGLVVNEEGVSL